MIVFFPNKTMVVIIINYIIGHVDNLNFKSKMCAKHVLIELEMYYKWLNKK